MTAVSAIVTYFDSTGDKKLSAEDFTREKALKFAAENPARQKELLAKLSPKLRKALLETLYAIRTDRRVTEPQCYTGDCFEFNMQSPVDRARSAALADSGNAHTSINIFGQYHSGETIQALNDKFRHAENLVARQMAFDHLKEIGEKKPGLRARIAGTLRSYYDTPGVIESERESGTFLHLWSDVGMTLRSWGYLPEKNN